MPADGGDGPPATRELPMRIRPTRLLRRVLAAGLAAVLVVPVYGCRAELTPPGAPTGWPAGQSRHWQWQWQLTGPLDPAVDADVFLLDPVATTAAQTAELRSRDRRLICQVRVGSVRSTDPDASRFPTAVQGSAGREPGSRWLDVRGLGGAGAGAGRPVPALPGQGLRRGGAGRLRRVRARAPASRSTSTTNCSSTAGWRNWPGR